MELDKDRLLKLLNLTGSEHDGEALAAIRKSNELLRQSRANWADALGLSKPASPPPAETSQPPRPAARPEPPKPHPSPRPPQRPAPPPGYLPARQYRDSFRREPLLPRLLGFPFWILVEVLGANFPRKILNTRGRRITAAFALSMVIGILCWIAFGYYLVFEA